MAFKGFGFFIKLNPELMIFLINLLITHRDSPNNGDTSVYFEIGVNLAGVLALSLILFAFVVVFLVIFLAIFCINYDSKVANIIKSLKGKNGYEYKEKKRRQERRRKHKK